MRWTLLMLATLAPISLAPHVVHAQSIMLEEGTRIRVTAPSVLASSVVGTVLSMDESVLRVASEHTHVDVPLGAIERLDYSLGTRRGASALKGAGIGVLVGPVVGGVMGSLGDDLGGFGMMAGVLTGLLYGPLIGAGLGALLARERWERLPMRASVAPPI